MKADIHPEYPAVAVTYSCGNKFETRSTYAKPLAIDVC
ncbi:50S ribosomal protein L31, partial [Pseudomonas chlororaphis]